MRKHYGHTRARAALLGAAALSALAAAAPARAQDEEEAAEGPAEILVVTGYRGALQDSTLAKRESNGFSDVIFSDDMGKLPSLNLAESLSRVPGIRINREVTGEGQQIAVRGLGPSFTKVTLNGNNIAIASDGALDSGNGNREVDLDIFPTELFSSLAVSKTPFASQLEGGIAGYVDMVTARPFDTPGQQISFSTEGAYTEINEELSPTYSFRYSNTFNDKFGVLIGAVISNAKQRVDGYESGTTFSDGCIGEIFDTNPDPGIDSPSTRCLTGGAPWIGRNHFFYDPFATQSYVDAHPGSGINVGDPLDPIALSGLTRDQLDRGILPYIGRPMFVTGERDRVSGLLSLQYRPTSTIELTLDVLAADQERRFARVEAMNWGRRNFMHLGAGWNPENMVIDANEVITQATLYNAHVWVGARDYQETSDFISVMPSASWEINDWVSAKLSASMTESNFDRDEPYFLYLSPAGVMNFSVGDTVPTYDFSLDISRPDIGWQWNTIQGNDDVRINRNARTTETEGLHGEVAFGEEPDIVGVRVGASYDTVSRNMSYWGGGNQTRFRTEHLIGSDAFANLQAYLMPSPVSGFGESFDGDVGYSGIATPNFAALKSAIDYYSFVPTAQATTDQFGQNVGNIEETYTSSFVEGNYELPIYGRPLRVNAGLRFVETEQILQSLTGTEPNYTYVTTSATYDKNLGSLSLVYDLTDSIKLRASASNTMTRANPQRMYPNAGFSTSGVESARAGNPFLKPLDSSNFDVGGEWYYGEYGYVGLSYFNKEIEGFTSQSTIDVPFLSLPGYGINIDNLSETQQVALAACGGPQVCTVAMTTEINSPGSAKLSGIEAIWVMPLDFIVEGLGFDASATTIDQDTLDPTKIITGIADWTYSINGYYENDLFQGRVTYYHQDGAVTSGFQGYDGTNGQPARRIHSHDRTQVDFATSLRLPFLQGAEDLSLTFDGYNVTNEPVASYFEHENATFSAYYPGATYIFGVRGKF